MALRTPLTVSPHMYIGDSTGRPLDNGMVYFGLPDQDPEFYPINIFSDDDLTIPVSQPVRSKGGYLNDNKGDMAEIHAKELIYSVKVLDQYGRKIFYKGQSMRSNWNDDVIIRIDEAILETSTKAEKVARDIALDALDGVAIDANLVSDALIKSVPKSSVGAVALTQRKINDRFYTPFDFGAIGDGTSHPLSERFETLNLARLQYPHAIALTDEIDWCALQALMNAVANGDSHNRNINWSGDWYLNRTVAFRTNDIEVYKTLTGDFRFTVRPDFIGDAVISLHGRNVTQSGVISGSCGRAVKYGVIVDQRGEDGFADLISFGIKLDRIAINAALIFAVKFQGNAMFSTLEYLRSGANGVANPLDGIGVAFTSKAMFSAKADGGVGGLLSQSILTVDKLPDYDLTECACFVDYNGYVSKVTNINRATFEITVAPHLPVGAVSPELSYIWGGGVSTEGADSANISIGQMSIIGSGIALYHTGLYSVIVQSCTTEFCGIALFDAGLVGGANIIERYFEGNSYDFVSDAANPAEFGGASMLHGLALDYDKVQILKFGRDAKGKQLASYGGLRGAQILEKGILHAVASTKYPQNYLQGNFLVNLNEPHRTQVNYANNLDIGFMNINTRMNDLFCYDSQEFVFVGGTAQGAPTGTISIIPPLGYTVNGSASTASFSGFKEAARFVFYLEVATKNIKVVVSGMYTQEYGANSYTPSSITDAKDLLPSWHWVRTSLIGLPTPTRGSSKEGNIRTYFAYGTIGEFHYKKQIVEYTVSGDVWERVYSSADGAYGAWTLVSTYIRKGNTASRPNAPIVGMRYYDTTLLASGKPIEWNGSSWVDGLGVAV